jgi:hypothetical protein
VRIGLANAKKYHLLLIIAAILCLFLMSWYVWVSTNDMVNLQNSSLTFSSLLMLWAYIITLPFFVIHIVNIMKEDSAGMDKYLKQLAMLTVVLVLFFGTGLTLFTHV